MPTLMKILMQFVLWYHALVADTLFIAVLIAKGLSFTLHKKVYDLAKQIIMYLSIASAIVSIVYFTISFLNDSIYYRDMFSGGYGIIYWIMLVLCCLAPFTLTLKRLRNNGKAIFGITLLINIGWAMQRAMTVVGYQPFDQPMWGPFNPLVNLLLRGILAGLVLTGISISILRFRKTELPENINSK